MKTYNSIHNVPKNFTGICNITNFGIYHYKNGKIHNEGGPAVERAPGHKEWFMNGFNHREDGPAVEYANGGKKWCYKNKRYGYDNDFTNESWKEKVKELKIEEEKTSVIEFQTYLDIPDNFTGICKVADSGNIYHMKGGKAHNESGPAVIWKDGSKIWCMNDLEHREDGPAYEYSNGLKYWNYKGKHYGQNDDFTIETWKEKVKELKRKEEKENMIEFKTYKDIPRDFTGICKVTNTNYICHMKDRGYHNENGPAVIEENGNQGWYYMGNIQGYDNAFTNETWIEKVKELKAQQEKTNMIEFKTHDDIPKNFTGVCKVIDTDAICHIKDGIFHNESGSACTDSYGNKFWLILGFRHRENGPAIQYSNGNKEWWYKDTMYGLNESYTNNTWMEKVKELKKQEDNNIINVKNKYLKEQENPKMIEFKKYSDVPKDFTGICKTLDCNSIRHYKDGLVHREGGPAVITENGDLYYYINGLLHRTDGPAFDCVNGHKEWFVNGKCHRFNGPAIEDENGYKEWFIEGISYSESEFKTQIKKINDKSIDDFVTQYVASKSNLPKIVTKATYRVAATQITNIVKESLIKIISKDRNQAIQILNSEFGKAIIQAVCGIIANEINSDNIYIENISQELMTSSIATVGDVLFDTINSQIPEILKKTISNFSKSTNTRIFEDDFSETEEETAQNLSLTL